MSEETKLEQLEETMEENTDTIIKDEQSSTEFSVEEALRAKITELEELNNRYLRLQADFDNHRKRTLLEKEGLVEMVSEMFIKDFLPVIDNFERAVQAAKTAQSFDSVVSGLEMALKQFQDQLEKKKITPVAVGIGEPFDPEQQEVIMMEDNDNYPESTVIEELQKGYLIETKFGSKLIRPALVKITK